MWEVGYALKGFVGGLGSFLGGLEGGFGGSCFALRFWGMASCRDGKWI